MSANHSRQHPTPPSEGDDSVWGLLEQAPPPVAGPMFSRQVMRTIRMDSHRGEKSWWRRLVAPLAVSTATAVGGIILGFAVASHELGDPGARVVQPVESPAPAVADAGYRIPADDDELVMTIADLTGDYSHVEVLMLLGL
jgi:hypothetical protein